MIDIYGTIVIILIGVLANLYVMKYGYKNVLSIFCSRDDNIFEHLKVVLGPTLIWFIIEIPFLLNEPNFLIAKSCTLMIMCICMPLFYYGYGKVSNSKKLSLELISFILSVSLGQMVGTAIILCDVIPFYVNYISLIIVVGFVVSYLVIVIESQKRHKSIITEAKETVKKVIKKSKKRS